MLTVSIFMTVTPTIPSPETPEASSYDRTRAGGNAVRGGSVPKWKFGLTSEHAWSTATLPAEFYWS